MVLLGFDIAPTTTEQSVRDCSHLFQQIGFLPGDYNVVPFWAGPDFLPRDP